MTLLQHSKIDIMNLHCNFFDTEPAIHDVDINAFLDDEIFDIGDYINKDDSNIICYVAGYIAHVWKRKTNSCESCIALLMETDNMPLIQFDIDVPKSTEFVSLMSRGGLKVPSDFLFLICCFAYAIFTKLRRSPKWFSFMQLPNSSAAFIYFVIASIEKSSLECLLSSNCRDGHSLSDVSKKIIFSFFNTLSKSSVNSLDKKTVSNPAKIRKLSSK